MRKRDWTKSRAAVLYAVLTLSNVLPAWAQSEGSAMHKTAQHFIAEFRRGEDFRPDDSVRGLVVDQRIASSATAALAKELATGTPEVRVNIVRLLEQIGLQLSSPKHDQFAIIRDPAIMRLLLVEGFAKDDAAADAAATILQQRCKPSDLARFNDLYEASLRRGKGDYLLLAAKAKTIRARPYVDNMSKLPAWRTHKDDLVLMKIVRAALGDTFIEDEFLTATLSAEANAPPAPKNRFYDVGTARDGSALAERIRELGLIGTRRTLQLACKFLRSPLKSYVPGVSERSIRHAALDALLYNFPNERVLSDPITVADWTAVEAFCTNTVGAIFAGPTPDIAPAQAYPRTDHARPAATH